MFSFVYTTTLLCSLPHVHTETGIGVRGILSRVTTFFFNNCSDIRFPFYAFPQVSI